MNKTFPVAVAVMAAAYGFLLVKPAAAGGPGSYPAMPGYVPPYMMPPPMPPHPLMHNYRVMPPRYTMPAMPGYRMQAPADSPPLTQAVPETGETVAAVAPASTANVAVTAMRFADSTVRVKKGGVVTWTNQDAAPHTITASNGSFDSPRMGQGDTFSHAFDQTGSFAYYCKLHPMMRGTVVVVD